MAKSMFNNRARWLRNGKRNAMFASGMDNSRQAIAGSDKPSHRRAATSGSWVATCLVCVLLAQVVASTAIASEEKPGQLLIRADAVRNIDPKAFGALVGRIEQSASALTSVQQQHLRLLKAYGRSYQGRYDAAIKEASSLFDEATDPNIKFRSGLLVANSAAITRDFSLGLRHLSNTLELDNGAIEPEFRQAALGVAAVLHNQLGQYALGQHYAEQLLDRAPTARNRCAARQVRIEALYGLGSWVKDDSEVDAAISDCAEQKEVIAANFLRGYLARRFASQGKAAKAIELL